MLNKYNEFLMFSIGGIFIGFGLGVSRSFVGFFIILCLSIYVLWKNLKDAERVINELEKLKKDVE